MYSVFTEYQKSDSFNDAFSKEINRVNHATLTLLFLRERTAKRLRMEIFPLIKSLQGKEGFSWFQCKKTRPAILM